MKTIDQLGDGSALVKMELMPYGHYVGKIDYHDCSTSGWQRQAQGQIYRGDRHNADPPRGRQNHNNHGPRRGAGQSRQKCHRRYPAALGRPDHQHQRLCSRRRHFPAHTACRFRLGLTGDIDAITNAHNLAMVALTTRMQHELNYTDEHLKKRGLRRLNIDSKTADMGWVIDFCAQSLRNIIIGLGGKHGRLHHEVNSA